MIWKSVVGKLWATILLFFSVVLLTLSFLLMQFIGNFVAGEVTNSLTNTAGKISVILEQHDDLEYGLEVAWGVIDEVTKAIIITDKNHVYYSSPDDSKKFPLSYFTEDEILSKVFHDNKMVQKEITLEENVETNAIMVGVPLEKFSNQSGAVFLYQPLDVVRQTTAETTKLIWLAAFIAFVLTTVFAFFLSTRITAPLRVMREVALEVANGKFDTRVPKLTSDEIGELATAFNQMRKRLKINMTALNQEKEQLASILRSMADGVLLFDKEGKILVTNPPSKEFLTLWGQEHGGEPLKIPEKIMKLFSRVVQTGMEQYDDLSLKDRYWNIIVSPLYNQDKIRGAVAVLRDMTEERKLEKLRKDFVANVSHELRTPIAMLQGYSEALLDDVAQSEAERKELAKVINDESLRMGRLVNELLDLARMESGFINLNLESVQIKPFVERVVHKFSNLAKEEEIELITDIQLDCEEIEIDPDRIEQVLTNLIDNAIRHTPKGGKITVNGRVDGKGIYLKVQDTGSGIPPEDLPFVFERFYKADKARTRGKAGTGLGLAIAKNIVVAHDGEITVESKLGQGTAFTIKIPRKSLKS